jgi:hypothetical protein
MVNNDIFELADLANELIEKIRQLQALEMNWLSTNDAEQFKKKHDEIDDMARKIMVKNDYLRVINQERRFDNDP